MTSIGTNSGNFSGVIDLRGLERIISRIRKLEEKFEAGFSEIEWTGGVNQSLATVIKLASAAPTNAIYQSTGIAAGRLFFVNILAPSLSEFKVQGYCPTEKPAAGTKEKFYWLALKE